ncbi:MAG: hypothetical protein NZM37_06650 [Sandaracinaceae bacterium]|nr:hypothetical protein [Sandaracinaceae bacterium]MDW8245056.1 di-heme oxidoredictase family protein [Sandaracinaceae bacterium]
MTGSCSHEASPLGWDSGVVWRKEDRSDRALFPLSPEDRARFVQGERLFSKTFLESEGLGPLYIQRSCESCHEGDARGPGVVLRFVPPPGFAFGDTLIPRSVQNATPIRPPQGTPLFRRFPPPVFARGLIEAIPDETIEGWARAQAEDPGPVRGVPARLSPSSSDPPSIFGSNPPRLGRFGHKARSATLEAFVADALHVDMGLTSAFRPQEVPNPSGIAEDGRPGLDLDEKDFGALVGYVRLLDLPERKTSDSKGESLFRGVGCAECHVPEARTRSDHPIAVLANREVKLYTDLLLHDMGDGLADGIREGAASGRMWRTSPLIGLRFFKRFLHDGSARSVLEAIERHDSAGSEARESVAKFRALPFEERQALLRFVEGL